MDKIHNGIMGNLAERLTFSVVVPSYRRPEDLLRCLAGLQGGTYLPDEVVVALRDEDTDSQELLRNWCAANELGARVKTALATKPGQIEAMNCGLAAATAAVVCFTDDDCIPQPQWLTCLARHYADASVGGVGGRDIVHRGSKQLSDESRVVGRITWWGRIIGNHHCAGIEQPVDVA
ncbi:MAG: glycosyltransferase family 2 protein, partial [Armatimonadetes bacterium]|nr:glycosyltransferase family 2 protein [Armatimonadota bacterium]